MGNSNCKHKNLKIDENNRKTFIDKYKYWRYNVSNVECLDCKEKHRGIQKICLDHGIEQDWEILHPRNCEHNKITKVNINEELGTGDFQCNLCLFSIPIKKIHDNWGTDREKLLK